jgi:hypothetical protein
MSEFTGPLEYASDFTDQLRQLMFTSPGIEWPADQLWRGSSRGIALPLDRELVLEAVG